MLNRQRELLRSSGRRGSFKRRASRIALAVLGTLVLGLLCSCGALILIVNSYARALCGSTRLHVETSPDGAYDAVLFERNCGATDGFSTNVSIIPAGTSLLEERGNVLEMSGHPGWNDVTLTWEADRVLRISHRNADGIQRAESSYRDVTIRVDAEPQPR